MEREFLEFVDWESVKRFFGTTDSLPDAQWLLPDGSLLKEGSDTDHVDIERYEENGKRLRRMEDFLRFGAIRIRIDRFPVIDLRISPTKEQIDVLYDFVDAVKKDCEHGAKILTVEFARGKWEEIHIDDADRAITLIKGNFGL